ncbi:prephenate dehydrogenase (NADP(+)) [Dinochytrium kinnereticum]|nr:prephenate dehydrogenase (NADP(+)) [Dinochytrium kinnereticum]
MQYTVTSRLIKLSGEKISVPDPQRSLMESLTPHEEEEGLPPARARNSDMSEDAAVDFNAAAKEAIHVGIIGMGDMGRLYARSISAAGWTVHVCDVPEQFERIKKEFEGTPRVIVWKDGYAVSRRCDYIIYSVEASSLDKVVGMFGPATKLGAIVGGQTSVKEPEIQAFEKHLPEDVAIVTAHSMHGPSVDPTTQAMVIIKHRADEKRFRLACEVLSSLGSQIVHLTHKEHDAITADTQAVTHAAFLSMGHAWASAGHYPWEEHVDGIDSVKIHLTLRIFSNKWHVYAGLAILNPSARIQIRQYARSVSEIFSLMIQHRYQELTDRVMEAGQYVFGIPKSTHPATETAVSSTATNAILSQELIDDFARSMVPSSPSSLKRRKLDDGVVVGKRNSHLSLLAIADCWKQLGMNPYDHLVCRTPVFGLWMGITEHLFRSPKLLQSAINASLHEVDTRPEDMRFVASVNAWAECIDQQNFEAYRARFEDVQGFFEGRRRRGERVEGKEGEEGEEGRVWKRLVGVGRGMIGRVG